MESNLPAILRQAQHLSTEDEARLVRHRQQSGLTICEALIELKIIKAKQLTELIADFFAIPIIDVTNYDYRDLCLQLGLRELVCRYLALPIQISNNRLLLAVSDPCHTSLEDEFRFATGKQIEIAVADTQQLKGAIRQVYGNQLREGALPTTHELNEAQLANLVELFDEELETNSDPSSDDSPVSRYINQILHDAVRKQVSDIHFEPYENSYRIRFRCDGILLEAYKPSHTLSRRLAARLKIIAKLDIAQCRLPQDGRIKLQLSATNSIDMRISTLPTLWGEKIVLRLLDSHSCLLDIDSLGMNANQVRLYRNALAAPQGMILVTGPTGSGKTVSLYAGIRLLNTEQVNIATAEDPIEINLPGVNQVQVQPQIDFSFAHALRAFLRQDPDIVMVGEIRDLDTAEIAVKAAQTGHLVLSTLHTNSAAESLLRLQQMGIAAFNISSSLSLIVAQRLARKLCNHCKQAQVISPDLAQQLNITQGTTIYHANQNGCSECNQGYRGRTGIYEMMKVDSRVLQAINRNADAASIEQVAISQGMQTLKQAGIEKLLEGVTSYQELQRVLY